MYTLLLLMLACTGAPETDSAAPPETGSLSGTVYDCDLHCWADGSIEVSSTYWDTWLDGDLCADGSLLLSYGGECFQTRDICESPWADDPAVAEATECCGGMTAEELQTAPGCSDLR